MDHFKRKLKLRLYLLSGCAVFYIVTNCLLYTLVGIKWSRNTTEFIRGFQYGIGIFIFAVLVYWIVQYLFALNNAEKLKKLYILENDERRKTMKQKSGSLGMKTAIFGLSGAAVLAGYLDATVFFALAGASLFVALIHTGLKLYYRNKY